MMISIITACFNAETHIEQCLRSVAGQTHPDVEHIVIDGASKDRTVEIVRRFPHVAHLVCEADNGIYHAMNKGLALATGDFVLFLNADDKLAESNTLATAEQMIESDPGADVYYGWLEVRPLEGSPEIFRPPPPAEAPALMVCRCLPHQSTLARPSVFAKTGPFDLRYRFHADYDWFLKILDDPAIDVRLLSCVIGSFSQGGASSQLAKGQPEVYAIQNASRLYAGELGHRLRIDEYQKTLLAERIENARLRGELRHLREGPNGRPAKRWSRSNVLTFSRNALATLRRLRARRAWL